jgi:hypothetical protein
MVRRFFVRAAVESGQTVLFVTGHDPVLLVRVLRERSLAAVVLTSWVATRIDRSAPEHEQSRGGKSQDYCNTYHGMAIAS